MTISGFSSIENKQVKKIFKEIAGDYERVNSVISFGQIHRWRKELVAEMDITENQKVLDLGCGTGQLTKLIAKTMSKGEILGVDCTREMIQQARKKFSNRLQPEVSFATGKGEALNLNTSYFDLATSAFTLRNVNNLEQVIAEMKRVVRPGGKVFSLELAKPRLPLFRHLFFFYFNNVLPVVGGLIQGNEDPYHYLVKSLQQFPNQEKLKEIYEKVGLGDVYYKELLGGIAAIHCGKKRGNL